MTHFGTRIIRFLRWHRRGLAAIAAALCVVAVVSALRPPEPATTRVVRAAANLPAGHQISADDLVTVDLLRAAVPDQVISSVDDLIGQTLIGGVPKGQVLTEADIISGDLQPGDGQVLVPLRLRDAGIAALLQVGQVVAIVAADNEGTPVVVADHARIAALPRQPDGGTFGSDRSGGVLVVVAVPRAQGATVAAWATSPTLGVMFP